MPTYIWVDRASEFLFQIWDIVMLITGYLVVGAAALALIVVGILLSKACFESELVRRWVVWAKQKVTREKAGKAENVELRLPMGEDIGVMVRGLSENGVHRNFCVPIG
jgi:hypothetical protein